MPVWTNPSIADAPQFTLVSWQVFEVQLGPGAPITRHVAGEVGYGGEGQVSSPIHGFDPVTASFRTRSGRVYRVQGARGLGAQGAYVWNRWTGTWRSEFEPRDVTPEVAQAIAQARGLANYDAVRAAETRAARKVER